MLHYCRTLSGVFLAEDGLSDPVRNLHFESAISRKKRKTTDSIAELNDGGDVVVVPSDSLFLRALQAFHGANLLV